MNEHDLGWNIAEGLRDLVGLLNPSLIDNDGHDGNKPDKAVVMAVADNRVSLQVQPQECNPDAIAGIKAKLLSLGNGVISFHSVNHAGKPPRFNISCSPTDEVLGQINAAFVAERERVFQEEVLPHCRAMTPGLQKLHHGADADFMRERLGGLYRHIGSLLSNPTQKISMVERMETGKIDFRGALPRG